MPREWNRGPPSVPCGNGNGSVRLARMAAHCRQTVPGRMTREVRGDIGPNKSPIRPGRTGLSLREPLAFARGNESCVHRQGCTGGGSFCTARCRVGSAHSHLQEASAGRNLITLFHSVNNPSKKFPRSAGARVRLDPPHGQVLRVEGITTGRIGLARCFFKTAFFKCFFSCACNKGARGGHRRGRDGRTGSGVGHAQRELKIFFCGGDVFATQHARLRESAQPLREASERLEAFRGAHNDTGRTGRPVGKR